ncbi:MAG TPA: DUF4019 domain-containing protein [Candidatus Binatia bacterium]|nr:DUF4019 domain-containing protein [Candidatus Binatia bacterium]
MKRRFLGMAILCFHLCASITLGGEAGDGFKPAAAEAWLSRIDSGDYSQSWKEASEYFRGAVSEKGWVDALAGSRKPLGKLISRRLAKTQNARSLPGAPDGHYVVLQFDTSFSNKKSAVETVTFMRERDGRWKAAGYYIQ